MAVDVAVVHPLAPSIAFTTVKSGLEAVEKKAEAKTAHYASQCAESNIEFSPFVLSTFGAVGEEARAVIRGLVKARRSRGSALRTGRTPSPQS